MTKNEDADETHFIQRASYKTAELQLTDSRIYYRRPGDLSVLNWRVSSFFFLAFAGRDNASHLLNTCVGDLIYTVHDMYLSLFLFNPP